MLLNISMVHAQKSFSVLISEIMSDPSPPVRLPEHEFVELVNTSGDSVNLAGWIWKVGSRETLLPHYQLAPSTCVLLLPRAAEGAFSVPAIYPDKWLTLPNDGQYLVLKTPDKRIMHFATYSPALFEDALQRNGGYSLELTSLANPCSPGVWKPSLESVGGSPGFIGQQSVLPISGQELLATSTGWIDRETALIRFSDFLHPDNQDGDLLITERGNRLSWQFFEDRCDQVIVSLLPHENQQLRMLDIGGLAYSCSGHPIQATQIRWGTPQLPDSGAILFSEVMFEPQQSEAEFVEIYNASDQVFDLDNLILAVADEQWIVTGFSDAPAGSYLFMPGDFAVLCKDLLWLKQEYRLEAKALLLSRSDFPSLTNDGGRLILYNQRHEVLDRAVFTPDAHYPRLESTRGVSLERIAFDAPGDIESSWFSAAAVSGFSTPAQPNSQWLPSDSVVESTVWLQHEVFAPGNAQLPNQAIIRFDFEKNGVQGELRVYTVSGELVTIAHPWALLPVSGLVTWDGLDENGQKMPPGIYLLVFNYRDPAGRRGRFKKAVALMTY